MQTILADFDSRNHQEHDDTTISEAGREEAHGEQALARQNSSRTVGDRRQELVFIGTGLDGTSSKSTISSVLNECLLNDDEWQTYQQICSDENDLKGKFGELPITLRMITY